MRKPMVCAMLAAALSIGVVPGVAIAQTADEELSTLESEVGRSANGIAYLKTAQNDDPMLSISSNSTSVVDDSTLQDISSVANVAKIGDQVYTGKQLRPEPVITTKTGARRLAKGPDYIVSYGENKNVGMGIVTVTGQGSFKGHITVQFKIVKASNTIKVPAKKTLKASKLKKRSVTFGIARKAKEGASKTYKLYSVPKKAKNYIKVSKAGKVTVKRGLKKGAYRIKVKVKTAATKSYKKTTAIKTITIKVK